ncbi:High-affnity carbon uptake protein Hat/HatR [Archangium gephyra]|uniref:High-affnity carbon uptake protein Hat/HatR n=1 Tax=Archangium gephyra TaxID=48 RepID=A0AAC8TC18_9BACT|nr:High-affnity carbon uptake protein Hat/HatR [Archangium gephyra]
MVQLAYHPAIIAGLRSPLEDPLYSPRQGDSLLPSGGQGPMSPELKKQLDALRTRVREAYDAQLLAKIRAVLDTCRAWKVRLVVFPEYSIPWEILGGVADAAGDMVVVAGTHTVERAARRKGIYERLVAPGLPSVGQSVCPVLHQGRLLALQPKLNPAVPERDSMKPGEAWSPVALPEGLPGPMGVLICLDFLFRESERSRALVAEQLRQCRFLAIPSLTPHYTLPEFAGKAWEEARRYGRPVLYCDSADGGGTSLYVDEGSPADLRQFPERAGYLEPGDEGVIVADVNLGHERPGSSTRYDAPRAILPVAEATLVYQAQPAGQAYAGWLAQAAPLLAREDDEALEALVEHVEQGRDILLNAGALSGARARDRRLRRLAGSLDKVTSLEDLRRFTREVVLPPDVLPLEALRGAMARGAANVVFDWLGNREAGAAGLAEVEEKLRKAAEAGRREHAWATGVLPVLDAVASAVQGAPEVRESPAMAPVPEVRVVLPSGMDPAGLGVRRHAGWVLSFKAKPGDFRVYGDASREKLRTGARQLQGDVKETEAGPRFIQVRLDAAEELYSLAIAEGAERVAVVGVWEEETPDLAALLIAVERAGAWTLWSDGDDDWWGPERDHLKKNLQAALRESGLEGAELVLIPFEELWERLLALLARFESAGARARVEALREGRLREVQQQFIQPDALVDDAVRVPVLEALDAWLGSEKSIALVLGEFGSGKSTALAEWASVHWAQEGERPRLLLASLAGASTSQDAEALLLEAAALEEAPAHRAALRVLVRRSLLVPCFDGFDEMATRLDASELAGRLSELLSVAGRWGKVLVSSRTHYFSSEEQLRTAVTEALTRTLGQSAGFQRIELQPLTGEQVERLVRKILPEQGQADHALDRIARTYDLQDLVHRPLLLGMVLKTLDQLAPGSRVGRADLYEAYLARWLEQTRSSDPDVFTDEQKIAFAESLAEGLWSSGRPDCSWQELQKSVRARLVQLLPDAMPVGAAHLEIQGGAFFVHEGEDRYRFAHKSFLEYFLARAIVHTLPERPLDALRTRPLTPEVAAFVGEILRREGEPRSTQAVKAVHRFLTDVRPLAPDKEAAANAVRLLLGLARWAGDGEGWFPARADLRGVVLVKEDLRGVRFVGANLTGAELTASDLSEADLSDACLYKARLAGTRLFKTRLERVQAREADFTRIEADQSLLTGADLREARLQQSTWARCQWREARLDGAEITAWAAPASEPAWPQALSVTRNRLEAALATGHRDAAVAVAWDGEGRRLVSGGGDGTVRVWEVGSGSELARMEGHGDWVRSVAWDAEGRRLASGGEDGTVRVWEAESGRELTRLEEFSGPVLSVAWDAEGRRLASGSADGTVRVWEVGSGREVARLEGHSGVVWSVAWDSESRRLASGSTDGTVRVWDAGRGSELVRMEGHDGAVWSVAWDSESRRLASGGDDGTVRVWDAESGSELVRLEVPGDWVRSVAWDVGGQRLASGGEDGTVRVWEVRSGSELVRLEGHGEAVWSVAWDAEGRRLASAGDDGTVLVWDARSGSELTRLERHVSRAVGSVAWDAEGQRLASSGEDGTVRVWDAVSGSELAILEWYGHSVWSMAWEAKGPRLAVGNGDGSVWVWEEGSGSKPVRVEGHGGTVRSVAWDAEGRRLASGGDDGAVCVWDVESGSELARLEGHGGAVRSVAWDAEGQRLASGGADGAVRVWDAESGSELACLEGHGGAVWSVAWDAESRRLVSGGADGTVRVWDAGSGSELARLEGHGGAVWSVTWIAESRRLASGGEDGTVRVWDAGSGSELAQLEGHDGAVWSVAWDAEGRRLASGGDDGTVRVWGRPQWALLGIFQVVGESTLARTPEGFCVFGNAGAERIHLTLHPPGENPDSEIYLPLSGLRDVFHNPGKVANALAGEVGGDTVWDELEKLGFGEGTSWTGNVVRMPPQPVVEGPHPEPSTSERALAPNPFHPGPALTGSSGVPGREAVLSDLKALIESHSPALLRGPRRAGKTSILHALALQLASTHTVRHVSLEARRLVTEDDLARTLEPSLAGEPAPASILRARLRAEPASVLLIDEIANLRAADASVFAWLRAVGQESTSIVLVGSHWDWVEVVRQAASAPGSSFGNDVTPVNLGPLSETDALDFLVNTAPSDVPLARDGTARWIIERCGTWPFYLQVLGYAVVQAVRTGSRQSLVEPSGVTELYENRLLVDRDVGFFRTRWAELPARARAVLWRVRSSPDASLPQVRTLSPEDRKILRDTGLCDSLGRWLEDKPFYDWLRRIADEELGRN